MKKLFAKIVVTGMCTLMLFIAPVNTKAVAVPLWDATGSYVFSFEYGGSYPHDVVLTQDALGNLTGGGGYPAGGTHVYEWVIDSGSVSGDDINFTAHYTVGADAVTPQTTMIVTGTIAPNGTMSGTWSDNYQGGARNGTWSTTSGVAVPLTHVVVTPADLDNTSPLPVVVMLDGLNKWFMYNDTTDTVDNTLGNFVVGPGTPFFGTGSIEFTLGANPFDRKNIATFQFSGTPLASITDMSFGTYSHSGVGVSVNENPYLAFNVDFNGSGLWQRRLVYVPSLNGPVVQDSWQNWDAINGGNALWVYSGPTWPGLGAIPGTVPKTWNAIMSEYPGVRLLPVGGWLGVRVGEPGPTGYTGNVDYFTFGTNTGVTTFDFDPVPPNQAPVANAGADQTVTLPTNSATLDGSGSTDDGTITTYTWTQVSGPTVVDPNDVVGPIVTGLVEGVYEFQLVVTDNLGAISTPDTILVTVDHIPAPTNKDQCKNGGWENFTNPSFKNQGQCVAYTNHLENI